MALSFHQLHIFHTVAEKGSFSAAAQALHMTQPAVTMQIQALEEYFGSKLFHRSTKRIELSEAGKALLPYAKRSIELVRETDVAMSKFTHMLQGRLQLGSSLTVGEYILPRLLGPFNQLYPNIAIQLKIVNSSLIVEELIKHQLTFGLIEVLVVHPDIHTEAVLRDELKLIVPHGHPLLDLGTVTMAEAMKYPFILRERGSGTRQVMEEALVNAGIDPLGMRIGMELGSTGAVKSAVEAGLGITFLSQSSVKHELALGVLCVVPLENIRIERNFYAVYLKSDILPISAVTFLTFLREQNLHQWL